MKKTKERRWLVREPDGSYAVMIHDQKPYQTADGRWNPPDRFTGNIGSWSVAMLRPDICLEPGDGPVELET